jgi:hypothetical protein
MLVDKAIAPTYATMRPLKPEKSGTFPVYDDLAKTLSQVKTGPDPTVAHVLAVAAGYAYSEAETIAMIMARMGLDQNHCLTLGQHVDAMFIASTAFLVQSKDGSVVILAYRGTQPTNLINWLTDADVYPDQIAFPFPETDRTFAMHAGFYRNVLSTRYEVVAALKRALQGRSVLDDGRKNDAMDALPDGGAMASPMTTLYVSGHSLGGAMAAIMSVMLAVEPEYVENFAGVFRAGYTYGQPMVGSPDFAAECNRHPFLGENVIRFVYRRDPVPHLPPKESDSFKHFGQEFHYEGKYPWPNTTGHPVDQVGLPTALLEAPLGYVARQFKALRGIPFQFSLNDHGPQHYISALTPPGVPNEFGDAYLIPSN